MKPVLKQNPNRKQTLLLLSTLLMLLFLSNIQCTREIDTDSLIRIHVLASSNSDTDQQLKLKVKDDVIRYLQPALKQSDSLAESRRIILSSLPQIEQTALQTLQQNGCEDPVTLQYGHFDFPVKYYGSFSLPAGNYEALRILIGEGKGRNWWCVLFPPLCFTDSNVSSSGKYTDQTPDTHIQFKLKSVEWLKSLQNKENDLSEDSERP